MGFDYFIIDAFSDSAFGGNPAGVVLLTEERDDVWMASVAREINLSETAFVDICSTQEGEPLRLRWFTPGAEVDLCGHATLAAAHALGGNARFLTNSGELVCKNVGGNQIRVSFPADPSVPLPIDVAAALPDVTVIGTHKGTFDLLVEVESQQQVLNLQPNFPELMQIEHRGVIVTSRSEDDSADYVARCFYPRLDVPEDPVTGSAHCTLVSFWVPRLEKPRLIGKQLSKRGGIVTGELQDNRVFLSGPAVTVMQGRLLA